MQRRRLGLDEGHASLPMVSYTLRCKVLTVFQMFVDRATTPRYRVRLRQLVAVARVDTPAPRAASLTPAAVCLFDPAGGHLMQQMCTCVTDAILTEVARRETDAQRQRGQFGSSMQGRFVQRMHDHRY